MRDGLVVATQSLHGSRFVTTREVDSGSWVGRRFQGCGVATAMRRAVLHLSFAELGARSARSGAIVDNGASLRVSEKLGYVHDSTEVYVRRGEPASMIRLLLARDVWEERSARWPPVTVDGLGPCLTLFGLDAATDRPVKA